MKAVTQPGLREAKITPITGFKEDTGPNPQLGYKGLIPQVRGKPRRTKRPGTKVVTLAFGKSKVSQVN